MTDETLKELIAKKRDAEGYDPEFEALLARQWQCPHCLHRCTILQVLVPIGDPKREMACPKCKCEGIEPLETEAPDLTIIAGGKSPRRPG